MCREALFHEFWVPVTLNLGKIFTMVHHSLTSTQIPSFITIAHSMFEKNELYILIWQIAYIPST